MLNALLLVTLATTVQAQVQEAESFPAFDWPSKPPEDSPFELSEDIVGITFTGRHREYPHADCWYLSWASDGNLYSPFSDGTVKNVLPDGSIERVESLGATGPICSVGVGKVVGDDPLDLVVTALGTIPTRGEPFASRYPSGSLVHDGIWYHGSHPEGGSALVHLEDKPYPWAGTGPFTGFRISRDLGKTWSEEPNDPTKPLFDEMEFDEEGQPIYTPVRIGEPFFVDFGKNMQHSPDGKAYLVGHGASGPAADTRLQNSSWCIGDQAFLLRVVPSPETINDASAYEFFAGHDDEGEPVWTPDREKMEPLVEWTGRIGAAAITYNPGLKRYLFTITDGRAAHGPYDTFILESESLTGPWKLAVFMEDFGEQAYFVNMPSKFLSDDGRTAWLCYSANFSGNTVPLKSNPPGSRYGFNLQEIRLLPKE